MGIHANAFLLLLLFAPISKMLASLVDCTQYNELNVLTAQKTRACPEALCWITAATFSGLYFLGIPLYIFPTLRFTCLTSLSTRDTQCEQGTRRGSVSYAQGTRGASGTTSSLRWHEGLCWRPRAYSCNEE